MIAWTFVVLLYPVGGPMQSEAFDFDNAIACERKREVVVDYLLKTPGVMEFHVGDCARIRLTKKT